MTNVCVAIGAEKNAEGSNMKIDKTELLFLVANNAINLHSLSLNGMSEESRGVWKALGNPRPGDMAVEWTGFFVSARAHTQNDRKKLKADLEMRVGRIKEIKKEGKGDFQETVTYLDALNGKTMRWLNCKFLRIAEGSLTSLTSAQQAMVREE